jgi:hypothetical protein
MTKPKDPKEVVVQRAKLAAKLYNIPLPKVAAVFQKYPIDQAGADKAVAELQELRRKEIIAALQKAGIY